MVNFYFFNGSVFPEIGKINRYYSILNSIFSHFLQINYLYCLNAKIAAKRTYFWCGEWRC